MISNTCKSWLLKVEAQVSSLSPPLNRLPPVTPPAGNQRQYFTASMWIPAYHGKGVGSLLLKRMEEIAAAADARGLLVQAHSTMP